MAVIDTDFAMEGQTCVPNTELSESTITTRCIKAGIAPTAKMNVGLAWRSPDVSIDISMSWFQSEVLT